MDCPRTFCTWISFWMVAGPLAAIAQVPQDQGQPANRSPQQQRPAAQVVATVNGDPITQQEVVMSVQAQLRGQQADPQTVQKIQRQVVDGLINSRLVEQYALEEGPDVDSAEVKAVIDQLTQQLNQQDSSLEEFRASRGYTPKLLETRIEGSLAWQKFQKQQVTEENLRRHFQEHKDQFDAEEFGEARQQVFSSYVGRLWTHIVNEMKRDAEIRVATQQKQPARNQPARNQPAPAQPQR